MRLMFVGDINLGEYYTSFGHGPLSYLKDKNVFSEVDKIFSTADLIIGNLEAPLTTKNFNKFDPECVVLRGKPESSTLLFDAGFRVLQLANNHTVQHGSDGFNETVDSLQKAGIKPIGLKNQPVTIIKIKGVSLGFLSASDVPDNTDKNQSSYQVLDQDFIKTVKESVNLVDHLFVMLHWGLESSTRTLPYQIELISVFKNFGVRGIIGAHPHLFYEIWKEEKTIIAPSLGNFVFDLAWDKRLLQSGILDIEIKNGNIDVKIWPVLLRENGCLPTPSGKPLIVNESKVYTYDLGKSMKGEKKRKLAYFFSNFFKGKVRLKAKFILNKVLKNLARG